MPRAVKKLEEPHRAALIRVRSDTHSIVIDGLQARKKRDR